MRACRMSNWPELSANAISCINNSQPRMSMCAYVCVCVVQNARFGDARIVEVKRPNAYRRTSRSQMTANEKRNMHSVLSVAD